MTERNKILALLYMASGATSAVMIGATVGLFLCWREDQIIAPHVEPWSHLILFAAIWLVLCVVFPIYSGAVLFIFLCEATERKAAEEK